MLSDEEKKAIERLIEIREFANLIEKLQKENEELKNITKSYDSFLGDEKIVIADKKFFVNGYFQENFVSKDKIKAKIEELDYNDIGNFERRCKQEVLQSLLEKE